MSKEKRCKCPLCEQEYAPVVGMSTEEHLAKGVIELYNSMQLNRNLPCPRCGQDTMLPETTKNPVSRYADVRICDECGKSESNDAFGDEVLPLSKWYAPSEILKGVHNLKCDDYIPEEGKEYPLCDNPECALSGECNISAHMDESGAYGNYDKR